MAAMENHVRAVAKRFSAYAMPTMKRTTARGAKLVGRVLADRSLSRLLGVGLAASLDELEALKRR